jgi:2-(1,2-epoxy-1,2-dihydrophenyl)acetyl-CoA isomerase
MDYENLRFELADGVATITLNRPDAANAIDLALARELMQVAIRCDEDPTCAPCCSRARARCSARAAT